MECRARAVLEELGLRLQLWKHADRDLRIRSRPSGIARTRSPARLGPEASSGWQFTPGLFALLGTPAAMGRTFWPRMARPGRDVRRGAERRAVAAALRRPRGHDRHQPGARRPSPCHRGVMPPTFTHPYPSAQLWTPVALAGAALDDRKQRPYRVVARLRERRHARAGRDRAARHRAAAGAEHPDTHQGFSVAVRPLRDFYVGDARPLLWVLQGTAFVLLLIAVSNVASLVLVREAGRQRETAVRLALGASRLNLLRTTWPRDLRSRDSARHGGLIVAMWGTQPLPQLLATPAANNGADRQHDRLDRHTRSAGDGGAPRSSSAYIRRHSAPAARGWDCRARCARQPRRHRRSPLSAVAALIVSAQIAMSVLLLVGAGLLVRSFARLQDRSFGFQTRDVVTAQLVLPRDRYASTSRAVRSSSSCRECRRAPRRRIRGGREHPAADRLQRAAAIPPARVSRRRSGSPSFAIVTPAYFRTMAIPIRRGRVFDERERSGSLRGRRRQRNGRPAAVAGRRSRRPDAHGPRLRGVTAEAGDRCRRRYAASRPARRTPSPRFTGPRHRCIGRSSASSCERSPRAEGLRADRSATPLRASTPPCPSTTCRAWRARRQHLGVAALEHGPAPSACWPSPRASSRSSASTA